jgi:hypothetical protein
LRLDAKVLPLPPPRPIVQRLALLPALPCNPVVYEGCLLLGVEGAEVYL